MRGLHHPVRNIVLAALAISLRSSEANAQQITLAVGAWAGLASNQRDCSFEGRVKSIKIHTIDSSKGRPVLSEWCTFNVNGRALESWHYRDEGEYGKHVQRFVSIYDSHGRMAGTDISDIPEARKPARYRVRFDTNGRAVEETSFDPEGTLNQRTTYDFDEHGDIVKETSYGAGAEVQITTTRKYDSSHYILSEESRDSSGRTSAQTFRYDDNGHQVERTVRSPIQAVRYVSAFDVHGRMVLSETIPAKALTAGMDNLYGRCGDCGPFPGKTIYRYNNQGLIAEEQVIQPPDKLIRLNRYAYDEHGKHTQEWRYEADPSSRSVHKIKLDVDGKDILLDRSNGLPLTTYTYDSHGNWVKAVVTTLSSDDLESKRKIGAVTYRAITYY